MPNEDHPAGREFLVIGAVCLIVGAWLLHCYYDKSGRDRPFALRFLPAG